MPYGKGSVTDNSLNQHKEMAGAGRKDRFGVAGGSDKRESYGVAPYPPGSSGSRARGDGYRREAKS